MRVLIVWSTRDPAGSNLGSALEAALNARRAIGPYELELRSVDRSLLDSDIGVEHDLVVFLSKHAARSGNDAMCVHAIGNFGEARFGGENGMLVETYPALLTALYRTLLRSETEYTVSLEAVHHGPYSRTPSIFYELGSTEENWSDTNAARRMIDVLVDVLSEPLKERESFFGIGSNHYCAGFDRLTQRFDFAGSCAKHDLVNLTRDQLRWINTQYDRIVLDWNTLGREKERIVAMLDELDIAYDRRKRV